MILAKIVDYLLSFDKRLKAVEETQYEIANLVSEIRNAVSAPDGFIVTNGVVQKGAEDLAQSLKHPVQMQLTEATIEVQFAQAFYMTASPDLKDKLHEFMSENELRSLHETVGIYKKAEQLLGDAERRARESEEQFEQAKKDLDGSIERQAAFTLRRVVERMQQQLTNLEIKKDFVQEAEEKLKVALDKVEQTVAKASNKLKLHQPNSGRISTPS